MTRILLSLLLAIAVTAGADAKPRKAKKVADTWPDGTEIPAWFANRAKVNVDTLGTRYVITDHGVGTDSTVVQTEAIQAVIDKAAAAGGGVIVVPRGTFLSGSLFFKQGTHLHLDEGATLKGSDRIKHFTLKETRMEGQTLQYFSALVNAEGLDGFTITGTGTLNGNGHEYWNEFWIRRKYNKQCTNLEAMRPRLVYMSGCRNVTVQDVHLINSPFWTNHLYRCDHVRYLDCFIYAPTQGLKAPSSDAIDMDVCHDILIAGCYMSVNDDAVVLKGGKGTWADQDPNNGPNSCVMVDGCRFGAVHSCVTLGSESLYDRNIVMRNSSCDGANRVLWLKMRPDTPQHYEWVEVNGMTGSCTNFLVVKPWTQFFKPGDREMPLSECNDIIIRNVDMKCKNFFDVATSDKYALRNFSFINVTVTDEKDGFNPAIIDGTRVENVVINGVKR